MTFSYGEGLDCGTVIHYITIYIALNIREEAGHGYSDVTQALAGHGMWEAS